ncbi:YraN family protein [Desulfobacterales bacterium HSG2]|nr:YraN family protein [Desulfobacterales bacterium HSG2]
MLNRQQQFGKKSESAAVRHLVKNGYSILEQNYHTKQGEIDIIAKDGDTIVFVEVKARRSDRFGSPKWAITSKKQKKISMLALYYLKATNQSYAKARFDVVAISVRKPEMIPEENRDTARIEIVKNAFELAYE